MNVADSELVAGILVREGWGQARSMDEADVILFNTCTVRQHAEDRVLGRITSEARRKHAKPHLKIGILGCVAQRLGNSLLTDYPMIDLVVGTDQYLQLPRMLSMLDNWGARDSVETNPKQLYFDAHPLRQGRHSGFVTIMRGCDNYCSYCIVPHVRGHERSRITEDILMEVHHAGKGGFKDITLLGQNVNSYSYDGVGFPELLVRVNKVPTIRRVRFITSHPKDLSDVLIGAMAELDKVCEHIHLPMQAGDDTILQRMNRGYTSGHYLGLVEKLRAAAPGIAVTSDIMCGFPGETEEQFQRTFDLMEQIRFDYAYTFKYSPREGTAAADMSDQVPEEVRLERLNRLIDLQSRITTEVYREQIGTVKEVFVEQTSKKSDEELSGRSRDSKIVVFPGHAGRISDFVKVRITEASGWTLRGEALDNE
ncbi:MAG: tRNA (N6-isopentenyl adenosine(37)-C2)-methylthiotransferase MiaB [Candidatus Cloacimonetes bacterium]|nr:tRNA (N6-isopentenyl adenosine(37)-C2)-methylthiotransferase MiaB [Candidatus Cloacimonadota bacterium]